MGHFFDALSAGIRGFREGMGPTEYSIGGRPVKCPHCGETRFVAGHALLNTRGASLLNIDWANASATTLVCAECGRIEWYMKDPTETPN